MNSFFQYVIELRDKLTAPIKKAGGAVLDTTKRVKGLRHEVDELDKKKLNGLSASFGGLLKSVSPIVIVAGAFMKLRQVINGSQEAYKAQGVVERQLTAVMQNTMSATREEVDSIMQLTAAQQRLGVIGDEVQLAGAQELSTYLTKAETLRKLIPVMNDMLSQQFGLTASQEQAAQVASMLGKVMDGQVGALSRYGYKFDEAQEKILKGGTEAQRAAVLFDVVSSSVGGVNKALAETPEGIAKQQSNDLGDLVERIGGVIIRIKNAFAPLVAFFITIADKTISFFERNEEKINAFMSVISDICIKAFSGLISVISWARGVYDDFVTGLNEGQPVFVSITAIIASLTAGIVGYKLALYSVAAAHALVAVWQKVLAAYEIIVFAVKNATSLWTAAQWLLNVALNANPVGLIIAGIVALIALIAFLILKIDGWGEMWQHTVEGCKLTFKLFVDYVKFYFSTMLNGLMLGLNAIKKGWYEFKNAVGIGDKSENDRMLADITADTEARKKAIIDGARGLVDTAKKRVMSLNWRVVA